MEPRPTRIKDTIKHPPTAHKHCTQPITTTTADAGHPDRYARNILTWEWRDTKHDRARIQLRYLCLVEGREAWRVVQIATKNCIFTTQPQLLIYITTPGTPQIA